MSDAVREGTRQVMAWLHGWCGLLLGWVLYLMCAAGTLAVFRPEIGRWMRPETLAPADPVETTARTIDWLAAHAPHAPGWYMTTPGPRANTVEAQWFDGHGYLLRAFDAAGVPVPRTTIGGEFFYRLHFELQLPYPYGRMLAAAAAMAMLVALVSGVVAHRRILRDFFTFRPAKGQRSWLDAHNALGVFALPFHLMITFTGLVTLASLVMPWGIAANYGAGVTRFYAQFTPGAVDRAASGHAAALAPVRAMLANAAARGPLAQVSVINPGDAAAVVQVRLGGSIGIDPRVLSYDGATGRLLADVTEARPAKRTYDVIYGLHLARFAPGLLRWLYALGGLSLTGAIGSGLVLWIVKRRERAPLSAGNRFVERLNVGVIAGVPIAFAALFWANRLIPLATPARATMEVSAALWTAAAALVAGLALPPQRGWPLLLAVAALACAGAPVVALATGDAQRLLLPAATVLRVGDLLMFGFALAFGCAAWRAAR